MAIFDDVLIKIANRQKDGKITDGDFFVSRELKFLRVIYNRMAEFKEINGPLEMKEIEARDVVNKTIVDYNNFLGHLNRLGRTLDKTGFSHEIIPNYSRIYFYRNKTIEHWDDYLRYCGGGNGFTKGNGMIALPMNTGIVENQERKKLHKELSQLLEASLKEEYVVANPTVIDSYNEEIYSILEKIDPQLRREKISDEIVKKLFLFGFPLPIYKMEEFITELDKNLIKAFC